MATPWKVRSHYGVHVASFNQDEHAFAYANTLAVGATVSFNHGPTLWNTEVDKFTGSTIDALRIIDSRLTAVEVARRERTAKKTERLAREFPNSAATFRSAGKARP